MHQLRSTLLLLFLISTVAGFSACKDTDKRSETANIDATPEQPKGPIVGVDKPLITIPTPEKLDIKSEIEITGQSCIGSLSLTWVSEAPNTEVIIYTSSSVDGHKAMKEYTVNESPWIQEDFSMGLDEELKFYIQLVSTEDEKMKSERAEFPSSLICSIKKPKDSGVNIINNVSEDRASADLVVDQALLDPSSGITLGYLISETQINTEDENLDWTTVDIEPLDPASFVVDPQEETRRLKKDIVTQKDENKFLYILKVDAENKITCVHHQTVSFAPGQIPSKVGYFYNPETKTLDLLLTESLAIPPSGIATSTTGYAIIDELIEVTDETRVFRKIDAAGPQIKKLLNAFTEISRSAGGCTMDPTEAGKIENCVKMDENSYKKTDNGFYQFFDIADQEDQGKHLYVIQLFGSTYQIIAHHLIRFNTTLEKVEMKPAPEITSTKKTEVTPAICYKYGSCKTG